MTQREGIPGVRNIIAVGQAKAASARAPSLSTWLSPWR